MSATKYVYVRRASYMGMAWCLLLNIFRVDSHCVLAVHRNLEHVIHRYIYISRFGIAKNILGALKIVIRKIIIIFVFPAHVPTRYAMIINSRCWKNKIIKRRTRNDDIFERISTNCWMVTENQAKHVYIRS